MNGIEKITARIETDAKAETAEILREAEEKAAAVRAQYEAQAKQEAEEAKKAGVEAALRQAERLESAAQMEAKKQLLAAKQASLNEAFDKAQAKLLALPDDQYAELLAKMAVKAAKTGREEIILNAKDRDRVGPQVVAKANVLLAEAVKPQPAGKAAKGGKGGVDYVPRMGVCLETQFFPDSPNHPDWGDVVLRPGRRYDYTTEFRFV